MQSGPKSSIELRTNRWPLKTGLRNVSPNTISRRPSCNVVSAPTSAPWKAGPPRR